MIIFSTQARRYLVGPDQIEFELLPHLTQIFLRQDYYTPDDLPAEIVNALYHCYYTLEKDVHQIALGIGNISKSSLQNRYIDGLVYKYYLLDSHMDGGISMSERVNDILGFNPGTECLYFLKEANPR